MKYRNELEPTLTIIAVSLLLLLLVAMPIDIIGFYQEKFEYAQGHQLDTTQENWEWQYLSGWLYVGVLVIVGLTITILRLIKQNNTFIRRLNWVFLLLFFSSMIFGFFKWMKTGYDH